MKRPFIWAHRGESAHAPENTMAAFNAALASYADGIELDIHLSADGVPVVIHDETLDRTTDGVGPVRGMTWVELQQLDAGGWFSADFVGECVPSLEEVLRAFSGKLLLNLELKEFSAGIAVLKILSQFPQAEVVVSSFNHKLLKKLKGMDQQLQVAVLFDRGSWRKALALAIEMQARSFHPRADLVTRPMVSCCHSEGLPVHVWTVDDPFVLRSLRRAGVDGIFANDTMNARSACFKT